MRSLFLSALALLVVALPARAQTSVAPAAPSVVLSLAADAPAGISPRLIGAIETGSASERAEALHAVVSQAYAAEGADLRPALDALLDVSTTDPDARHRILAVRALEMAGDDDAMAALRSGARLEKDLGVQRLLFAVLLAHYGEEELRYDDGMAVLAQSLRRQVRS